jgi:hypothetical protein
LIAGESLAASQSATPEVFADVPASAYYYDAVYMLQEKGITSGCSIDDYCPTSLVTRAQMAIFIVRAVMGGDNFTASSTPYFSDVPPSAFGFAWIQKLYELGITNGCTVSNYCPTQSITRAQMAVFIVRARYGAPTFVYPALEPYFSDVPYGSFAYDYIQRMAQDQITTGCAPTLYCPNNPVTRGDMAIFIMRGAFNQLLPPSMPVISKISQCSLAPGATATITITGVNTGFIDGETAFMPVPGITVTNVVAAGPTSLTAEITAGSTSLPQPVAIWIATGSQQAVLPNALTIQ